MELARVLGVAGWQGAGKTTLLESLVAGLAAEGLSVAVVEHDVHGLDLDVAGKDSDRLFRAGADVVVDAPVERFARVRRGNDEPLGPRLLELERRYDLVLVEGYKGGPQPKVWLLRPGETAPPPQVEGVLAVLPSDADRVGLLGDLVRQRLAAAWSRAPRRAGVLVGGLSRRMGEPKQWLRVDGAPLLDRVSVALRACGPLALLGDEHAASASGPSASGQVVAGAAEPAVEAEAPIVGRAGRVSTRLPDAPGIRGPLAGILAAMRWDPVCWVIAACDLPRLRPEAVDWLLAERRPGRWAVLPRVAGVVQPLLAVYEPQALPLLEAIAAAGAPGPSRLEGHPHVATPEPPPHLADCWRGVNTPEELAEL